MKILGIGSEFGNSIVSKITKDGIFLEDCSFYTLDEAEILLGL